MIIPVLSLQKLVDMSAKLVDMCAKIQALEKLTKENNTILTEKLQALRDVQTNADNQLQHYIRRLERNSSSISSNKP